MCRRSGPAKVEVEGEVGVEFEVVFEVEGKGEVEGEGEGEQTERQLVVSMGDLTGAVKSWTRSRQLITLAPFGPLLPLCLKRLLSALLSA